jgi:hypothetical protein
VVPVASNFDSPAFSSKTMRPNSARPETRTLSPYILYLNDSHNKTHTLDRFAWTNLIRSSSPFIRREPIWMLEIFRDWVRHQSVVTPIRKYWDASVREEMRHKNLWLDKGLITFQKSRVWGSAEGDFPVDALTNIFKHTRMRYEIAALLFQLVLQPLGMINSLSVFFLAILGDHDWVAQFFSRFQLVPQKFSLVRRSRFFQNHIHQRARVTTGYPLATVWGNSEFLLEKFLSFIMRQGVGTPPGVGVRFLQSGSETPAAFIPRFSGVPYGFNRVHSIRNSPISLASGCSTFHHISSKSTRNA